MAGEADRNWTAIRDRLADPKWDFRTVAGLARATGLDPEQIEELLAEHADEVRISNVRDMNGQILYTLANRPMKMREWIANTHAFIAKSSA